MAVFPNTNKLVRTESPMLYGIPTRLPISHVVVSIDTSNDAHINTCGIFLYNVLSINLDAQYKHINPYAKEFDINVSTP